MNSPQWVNEPPAFKAVLREAMHYWEPRRLVYNIVLAAVVAAWLVFTWPHFRPAFTMQALLALLVLAAMANACYCAAYLVDAACNARLFAPHGCARDGCSGLRARFSPARLRGTGLRTKSTLMSGSR